jgi:hypothetical protein
LNSIFESTCSLNRQSYCAASSIVVMEVNDPIKWRLATSTNDSAETEELVVRVQGILCERDLPPLSKYDA